MAVPYSVAFQLALVLAYIPALALAGHIAQPAPIDAAPAALSVMQDKSLFSDDRFFQEQKLKRWKDEGTVVASASGATKTDVSTGLIPAKGVVLKVDQAKATVKIDHDPIPALNWPRMTMPFRLKERALADNVKEGDAVEFFLEKSGSDYVIVKFGKPITTKASP